MKSAGSLVAAILIGIVVLWIALKLLGAALKLLGIFIALALAVGAYFVIRGMISKGGKDG
ncbi:MAG TPA: hypothetical protein VEZ20_08570 [Allosphingosinicella sp.]|nr:hypothetical protein [Allosphingosinicella sp.]